MLLIRGEWLVSRERKGMLMGEVRMNQTIAKMQKMKEQEYSSFLRVLFGMESPTPLPENLDDPETGDITIEWVDGSLNDSQKDAIRFALASREVALIHGPPGVSNSASCHLTQC
jgi:DNA polymerase alpha-associated DNA helicase A